MTVPQAADPTAFNLPSFRGLGPEHVDGLARAVLLLTREVCVLHDRLAVTEAVLAGHGMSIAEAVDTHQPDAALQARIDARTEAVVGAVLEALAGL